MLDVLVPVLEALRAGAKDGLGEAELIARVRQAADEGLAATRDIKATKGRASYLGERSIGHLDPGAQSSALLIAAVCDVLEQGR
jgi:phosphoenolpyruvate---glycerone phosphotransferase subunit DhaL